MGSVVVASFTPGFLVALMRIGGGFVPTFATFGGLWEVKSNKITLEVVCYGKSFIARRGSRQKEKKPTKWKKWKKEKPKKPINPNPEKSRKNNKKKPL